MWAICKKEFKSYFNSPIAYVLIGLFILVSSVLFTLGNIANLSATFSYTLGSMGFILIFIVPILTMRILSEDRKNGTEVLLITSPVSLSKMIIGKYLAALFVFLIMIAITLIYPIILIAFGQPDIAPIIGGYIGFILLGASFISIGLFASSLTENQIIAAVISFVALLLISIIDAIASFVGGFAAKILMWFSLMSRYEDFNLGILDFSSIIYYLSFIAVFLFLTIRMVDRRRWSQGWLWWDLKIF